MNTMTLDAWCKPEGSESSFPMGLISLRINDDCHLTLENEEERLEREYIEDMLIPVNPSDLDMTLPKDCGELSDCSLRLYLGMDDHRGQFHLVGHRASDGALIYTNAVMIDQLG